jgi:tRNA nucleotidyltransferase/poly(A) polymerase
MKIYLVGGAVRDKLLGVQSNDLDYVVVLDSIDMTPSQGYNVMRQYMIKEGFSIFLDTPEMFTIRGRFPKGHTHEGNTGDFVLARKEVGYEEGTRRPVLELGTLFDDLVRRDFTVNAMAEDESGNIIDFFRGKEHLDSRLLVTPSPSIVTFDEDPLRVLRALRFSITKGFMLSQEIEGAISNLDIIKKLRQVVSQERIREEVLKMTKYNTIGTINILNRYNLLDVCFGGNMWLKPTFEKKN